SRRKFSTPSTRFCKRSGMHWDHEPRVCLTLIRNLTLTSVLECGGAPPLSMGGWTRNSCGSWKGFLTRFGSSAPGVKRSPKRVPSRLVLWLMCPPLFMCQRIRQVRPGNLRAAFVLAGLMAFFALHQARALNQLEPGLAITFTTADSGPPKTSDVTVLPNVQLYVPADTPPTPFLPGGRFSADW